MKFIGYGGKRFRNYGKFCIDCVWYKDVVYGWCVEFFVFDYGSNLFLLKFICVMKIIKIMCGEEIDCKDCYGFYDVSEVKDGIVGEKEVNLD